MDLTKLLGECPKTQFEGAGQTIAEILDDPSVIVFLRNRPRPHLVLQALGDCVITLQYANDVQGANPIEGYEFDKNQFLFGVDRTTVITSGVVTIFIL